MKSSQAVNYHITVELVTGGQGEYIRLAFGDMGIKGILNNL